MKVESRPLLAVVTLGALVHGGLLGFVAYRNGGIDGYAFQSVDSREYCAIAKNLVEHGTFSQDEQAPLRPDTWRTPGYPFFLAGLMAVVGKSPTGLILAQQVLSILNVALLFGIARRRMSDRRALVIALLFLIEPYHLYYSLWLMSTTLQTTLILVLWSAGDRAVKPYLLGVLGGILVLVWPGAIFVPVAVFALLAARAWRLRRSKGVWFVPIRFALVCGLATSTWMVRNALVADHFALSHQSGIVLAYFKATEVILWHEGRTADRYLETSLDPAHREDPHRVWDAIDDRRMERYDDSPRVRWPELAQGNRTDADSFRLSSELTGIVIERLWELPFDTLVCCLVRCGQILAFPLDLAVAPPNGVVVNRSRSAIIGGAYALLAGWVLFRLIRYRDRLVGTFFAVACTLALLAAATPQTDPRFRVPMIPMLLFVALVPRRAITGRRQAVRPEAATGERGR